MCSFNFFNYNNNKLYFNIHNQVSHRCTVASLSFLRLACPYCTSFSWPWKDGGSGWGKLVVPTLERKVFICSTFPCSWNVAACSGVHKVSLFCAFTSKNMEFQHFNNLETIGSIILHTKENQLRYKFLSNFVSLPGIKMTTLNSRSMLSHTSIILLLIGNRCKI